MENEILKELKALRAEMQEEAKNNDRRLKSIEGRFSKVEEEISRIRISQLTADSKLRTIDERLELIPDKVELWGKLDDTMSYIQKIDSEQLFDGKQTRENTKAVEELDRRVKILEGQQSLI